VLDLNFSEEFSKRSEILLSTEESRQAVLDEFDNLDPREANIIYRSFSYTPGSLEHKHAKVRINALVASGSISEELGSLANMENIQGNNVSYDSSRLDFLAALDNQALFNADKNPYDPYGNLEHMVNRGDSKADIKAYLEKNLFYQSQVDLANSGNSDNDVAVGIALFKFKELNDALEALQDPEQAPDFVAAAKKAIAPYDEDGTVAKEIDRGASSQELLIFLSNHDKWNEDAQDFLTRNDVDMPTIYQEQTWGNFQSILNALKDLDSVKATE
jgi:hypothetical protein